MPAETPLVALAEPRSPAAEAYRALRTNLVYAGRDQRLAAVLVTTPAPEPGKGLALANLAVALAQGGHTTILVDADLRRPRQHALFGVPREPGLSDLLSGLAGEPAPARTAVEGLCLVPAGAETASPADLLSGRRLDELVAALRARAAFVLFDAPPILAVTDAAVLAARVDGVLLAVSAGATRREHAQRARDLLRKVNANLLGTVLLDAPVDRRLSAY